VSRAEAHFRRFTSVEASNSEVRKMCRNAIAWEQPGVAKSATNLARPGAEVPAWEKPAVLFPLSVSETFFGRRFEVRHSTEKPEMVKRQAKIAVV
jgi:hypothetical protein